MGEGTVTDLDRYLFDLRGYLVLRNAVSKDQVAAMNEALDQMPDMEPGDWYGYVHRENFEASRGIAYQQIYEAGAPFEALIDNPSWIEKVKTFIGGEGTFRFPYWPSPELLSRLTPRRRSIVLPQEAWTREPQVEV